MQDCPIYGGRGDGAKCLYKTYKLRTMGNEQICSGPWQSQYRVFAVRRVGVVSLICSSTTDVFRNKVNTYLKLILWATCNAKRKLYWLCLTMKFYTIRHSVPFQRSQSVNLLTLCPYMHCCQNINCLLKVLSQSSSFSSTFLALHSMKSTVTKLTVQLNIHGFKGSSDGKHLQISSSYDTSL